MNQSKNYTKMILDRLNKKIQKGFLKSQNDSISNKKTESTPTDSSNSKVKYIRQFFDSFQTSIVTIHEPVFITQKKPMRRCLFYQLSEIQFKMNQSKQNRRRLITLPASKITPDNSKANLISSNRNSILKESRPYISLKKNEQKIQVYSKINSKILRRYKSMKIL